jgi:hypothetical protein
MKQNSVCTETSSLLKPMEVMQAQNMKFFIPRAFASRRDHLRNEAVKERLLRNVHCAEHCAIRKKAENQHGKDERFL